MCKSNKNIFVAIIAALSMGVTSGGALAGGFLDVVFDPANFGDPLTIDNPYWPLNPDGANRTFTYIGETEDECVIVQTSVNNSFPPGGTYTLTGGKYAGLVALQVLDTEYVFEDLAEGVECDLTLPLDPAAIKEKTLDWYMQDDLDNIWYVGEYSQHFEEPEEGDEFDCREYDFQDIGGVPDQCTEGSWEAGIPGGDGEDEVVGEAGIVVPSDEPILGEPLENGNYFMQEVAFEAEDMAKIKRQHASLGEFEDCRKTKEWTALEPGGSVEHKWYCADGPGLVLIEGVGGGPTEFEVLVDVDPVLL